MSVLCQGMHSFARLGTTPALSMESVFTQPMLVMNSNYTSESSVFRNPMLTSVLAFLILLTALMPLAEARSSLVGDPRFKETNLPVEARPWYKRIIETTKYRTNNFRGYPTNPDQLARSGDPYFVGRPLNQHITMMLISFRQTGDLRLLDEVVRLMDIARAQLRDPWLDGSKDGFLNWRNTRDGKITAKLYGKDIGRDLDEVLYSAVVSQVAYACHLNRNLQSPKGYNYAERADFWKDFMVNHFVKKWRKRNKKPTGFPYLKSNLMHIYANQIRCHYYMYKLTNDTSYLNEAKKLARNFDANMVVVRTPAGEAYVWSHSVHFLYGPRDFGGIPNGQPTTYYPLTYLSIIDLHMEGFEQFASDSEMRKYMIPLRDFVLDGKSDRLPLARGIVGDYGDSRIGRRKGDGKTVTVKPFGPNEKTLSKYGREPIQNWARSILGMMAAWDNTTKLSQFTAKSYNAFNRSRTEKPILTGAHDAMFFTIMKKRGGSDNNPPPPPPPVVQKPAAPGNPVVTAVSASSLRFTWSDKSNNEDGFEIQQSRNGSTWTSIAEVDANVKAHVQTGLIPKTRYYFRVRAFNDGGDSTFTSSASGTTLALATAPAKPLALTASAISRTEIRLTWDDQADNETGFKIERSSDGGRSYSQVRTTGSNVEALTVGSLTPSTRYHFRVRAYNSVGNSAYSNIDDATTQSTPNVLPTVSLTAPVATTNLTLGASLVLKANASDSDGSIAKVEFFDGSSLIGTDATSPYSVSWKPTAGGAHSITAKATDNRGGTKVSTAKTVNVKAPNLPPVVNLTIDASATSLTAPANILLTASVSNVGGTVTKVEFYANGTLVSTDTSAPYTGTWSNVAAGTHTLTAKAFDSLGLSGTSSPLTAHVVAPSRSAIFVTDDAPLRNADRLILNRLTGMGIEVTVKFDHSVAASDATDKQLVLISSNVNSVRLGARLRDIAVPVVCWEPYLYDDMGMTGPLAKTDYDWIGEQTTIRVNGTSSPIAAGTGGAQVVYSAPQPMTWGQPSSAHVVATIEGKACIFSYRAGALMVGVNAPAKRVGIFMGNDAATILTSTGWSIFDAAVNWSMAQ
jgi:hypothetical protein